MAEQFKMMPDGLRNVSEHLQESASQMSQVIATLRAQIAGEGAGIACAVVPGDADSFWGSYHQALAAADRCHAGVMDYVANYWQRAADVVQQHDQA